MTESILTPLWLSVKVASLTLAISLPVSLWLGYLFARKNFKGKSILLSVIHLPLVLPPVTVGFLLLDLLAKNGLIGGFLASFGIVIPFSFSAAVLASLVVSFPLVFRSVRTAFEFVEPGLEEAARTLWQSKLKVFWKVTFPLALPGVITGMVLGFARSLGEFGATIAFAGNLSGETQTLPLAIYTAMQMPGQESKAQALLWASIALALGAMLLAEWLQRRMSRA